MHPTFHMDDIDLVTDRNNIRKLLSFASGKVAQSWRIDADVVGETIFFSRWELHQVLIITGARDSGYGHEFEKAFLHFDKHLRDSSAHHRVVRYDLGGINCMVRFEVDGCLDDGDGHDDSGDGDAEGIEESSEREVQVIERGSLVDTSSILELKSCSGSLRMQQSIPQLWISQTQHLFIGRHKDGLVDAAPQRFNMRDYFSDWEGKNQEALRGLVGLITKIREVTKGVKGGKYALVCKMEEKPRVLRIYERGGKGLFMPEGVKEWCWGRETGERI